ncbi:hypothetical protein DSO57_1023508 [Entomophthora muscae]|uniref:Uncharacterized protein n=1 Tax=Entomophthora muscae TaxID=34485 RepID=A0ACC2TED7_9FUNG|nr:hypothetical protein DSO57_1023508 [Entomophthora muscae]
MDMLSNVRSKHLIHNVPKVDGKSGVGSKEICSAGEKPCWEGRVGVGEEGGMGQENEAAQSNSGGTMVTEKSVSMTTRPGIVADSKAIDPQFLSLQLLKNAFLAIQDNFWATKRVDLGDGCFFIKGADY